MLSEKQATTVRFYFVDLSNLMSHDVNIRPSTRHCNNIGAINTWGRVYYLTSLATPEPSFAIAENHIERNFIIGNYHQTSAIDHDDGSRYFTDAENVLLYTGTKNFMGQHKTSRGNIMVLPEFVSPLDGGAKLELGQHLTRRSPRSSSAPPSRTPIHPTDHAHVHSLGKIFSQPFCAYSTATSVGNFSGIAEVWVDNTCITGLDAANGTATTATPFRFECPAADHEGKRRSASTQASTSTTSIPQFVTPTTANNTFFLGGPFAIACSGRTLTFPEWQAAGHDVGSVVHIGLPSDSAIEAMIRKLLGF